MWMIFGSAFCYCRSSAGLPFNDEAAAQLDRSLLFYPDISSRRKEKRIELVYPIFSMRKIMVAY